MIPNAFCIHVVNTSRHWPLAHYHMLCLYVAFHNSVRDHKTLRMTPAESIGSVKSAMTLGDVVDLMDARTPAPK